MKPVQYCPGFIFCTSSVSITAIFTQQNRTVRYILKEVYISGMSIGFCKANNEKKVLSSIQHGLCSHKY